MVGAERVHNEKRAARRGIGQRFSATALCVPRRLDVQQREPAFPAYSEAGDRIVAAIGSKQKPVIRREDDAARTLKVVRPGDVVDGAQKPRTGAARGDTFHLDNRAVCKPMIVDDGVSGLVRLHVKMSAWRRVSGQGRTERWWGGITENEAARGAAHQEMTPIEARHRLDVFIHGHCQILRISAAGRRMARWIRMKS